MPSTDRRSVALAIAFDALAVVVFVVVGRRNHDEGSAIGGIVATGVPFLIGLGVAWFAARVWRRPMALLTGLLIWPVTVLVGMVTRRTAFDDGTAASFVIVATVFLGVCFVGWRAAHRALGDRRRRADHGDAALTRG